MEEKTSKKRERSKTVIQRERVQDEADRLMLKDLQFANIVLDSAMRLETERCKREPGRYIR